ncbi:MAG: hypothetical protein KDE05_04200 [Parvularculaceae bacterium]|nr:hypothetical protein [Parvularculaceae bacterium]
MVRMSALVWALFSCGAATAAAPDVRTFPENGAPSPATIGDVAFLTGHWIGDGLGACAEEVMSESAGGQIMGMFRQMAPEGGVRFYEFYTIAEHEGSLALRIKHFNPDMTGWEEKDEMVTFPLLAIEGTTAYFDGLTFSRRGKKGFASAVMIDDQGVVSFDMRAAKSGESCS